MTRINLRDRLFSVTATPSEEQAARLQAGRGGWYVTQVKPPQHNTPATIPGVVKGITERATKWLGLRNNSPVAAFEIRRHQPDDLTVQFAVPTKRFDRKLRNQIRSTIPAVQFDDGVSGLPISEGETVGGATFSLGRRPWYPLATEFNQPPNNSVTSLLHRHAMPQGRFVIQLLFRPIVGRPVREWWWKRRAYKTVGYLRKEKEGLWNSRSATPRERSQADAVERKAATPRFATSLRVAVIGADDLTPSYVNEISGGYNVFDSLETDQYLAPSIVRSLRAKRVLGYAQSVSDRRFSQWSNRFDVSVEELGGLVSLPSHRQRNLATAHP